MNAFLIAQADSHGHGQDDGHGHGAPAAAPAADHAAPAGHDAGHAAAGHAAGGHGGGESLIAEHWQAQLGGMGTVNVDTVLYSAIVMIGLIVLFGLLGRSVNPIPSERSGKLGSFLEGVVEFCRTVVHDFCGPNAKPYLWYIGAIFTFIITANWISLLPWKAWEMSFGKPLGAALGMPHGLVYHAPTADFNLTLALGLITLVLYWYFGIANNGPAAFLAHHWFDKPVFLFPLRMLEDVIRPVSLALRLFANMTAGHILGLIILGLTYFVIPVVLLPLELFVGAVQAFVFAALSASYIGAAAADHSHSHSH